MGWRAARKLNWIRGLRPWPLAWSLNGGRDKSLRPGCLSHSMLASSKGVLMKGTHFPQNQVVNWKTFAFVASQKQTRLDCVLCSVQCHHVIHHKICKKVHLVWSAKGKKLFWWEAETLMRNASQSNLDSSKFTQRWDLNENWVTSPSSLQSCWRVMWIN